VKAIEHLDACGIPSMKLDATPQGKPLYEKLGFVAEYEIERWELQRSAAAGASAPVCLALEEILQQDREVFGADRGTLLLSLASEFPELVLQARRQEKSTGYTLGRRGVLADHLGPWMAQDESSARDLLDQFLLRSVSGRVFVDALQTHPWASGLLRERGFRLSRPLARMYRGRNEFPGRPDLQCAILGPEFG
jgi:Acetyltransferase (GNAT) domain